MARKVKQVNLDSSIDELTDADHKYTINGWEGLVTEVVSLEGFHGTIIYVPGVTFKQLTKK